MALSVEKLSKRWVLLFTPEYVHFIVGKSSVASTLQMFGQIMQDRIFEDYDLESMQDNKIFLEVTAELFVRALRSTQQALDVKLRLTKKDNWPMLGLTITNASKTGNRLVVTQHIPVRVIQQDESRELVEPAVGGQQVQILLPPIADVRTIVERMKALGSHVMVGANMNGEFVLKVVADAVKVETSFKGLTNPELGAEDGTPQPTPTSLYQNRRRFAYVRVDMRDFVRFLHSSVVNPKHVVCCIVDGQNLCLYVYLGNGIDLDDGQFIYYIPARAH
ncbi:DNA damage checkpoint control protein [Geranomyces variabilis]|uniref:Checkpoint protein n=1 Tax=Geranomyces variabilis TaxID=109894 RepID=A0AAD5TFS3_9FUNG|nr:DNA damage checkpoint control protein [Geranomyces variabilis]